MCQMYAIFEEVIGPQPSVNFCGKGSQQTPEDEDQNIAVNPTDQNPSLETGSTESQAQYDSRSKRSSNRYQRIYGSPSSTYQNRYASTLPRSSRRRLHSSSTADSNELDDTASVSSSNPLLDTISVLTYDPPDDSDDYYDLHGVDYDQCKEDKSTKTPTGSSGPEGDRDSIGYAGSSSIDSGYKSFCPTPEIPDSSIYGPDASRQAHPYSGYYTDSSNASQGRNGKPRIMMGTKVINRQGHVSPLREAPGSRRSDTSLYDVNLDHLMYLRQSLLSAIQKCESSKTCAAFGHEQDRTDSYSAEKCDPANDEHYLDNTVTKTPHPSYTKTVRFNTDVKVTTVNSCHPSCEVSEVTPCRTTETSGEPNGQKVQSKSILKDPLCANLRSQLEAGSVDCTLEEEIDSLLYGRAEFYDLESVDDFPCSYVTMIEEKYRSGKSSIAKVRKLKGEKPQDQSTKPSSAAESCPDSTNSVPDDVSRQPSPQHKPAKDNSSSSSTVSISKTAKCRFTEVARCMLEIIEDLQMKKLQPDSNKDQESKAPEPSTAPQTHPEDKTALKEAPVDSKASGDSYAAAAEYHVYEEIDYDFLNGSVPPLPKLQEVPPPLPARPSVMVIKPEHQGPPLRKRAPSPPPRKSRCPLKKSFQDGCTTEVRNRPKQRGNLYCLFSDRVERRNISRSLEREWRDSGSSDNHEDDYGFKKDFPSI